MNDIPPNVTAAGTNIVHQGTANVTGREADPRPADRSPDAATPTALGSDASVGVAVVAHTSRQAMARRLFNTIAADRLTIDDGTLGATRNHLQAWNCLHHNNTGLWSVVLEDDAAPVSGFRGQLAAALNAAPTPVVGLYLGRRHPEYIQSRVARAVLDAHTNDAHWITSTRLHHAVGVAIRTDLLADMLASVDTHQPIDEALSTWAVRRGHTIAYTHPSLVDHLDVEPVSQDRRPRQRRRAWRVGRRQHWTDKAVTL
ncbi:hypothetical protein [Mycobacterium riyadhense]|uniref:hypothetical protein n=1 Tax=Mycobacterium riyadhense TaxID=486698 RepID=UPI00195CE847|nr:hypothetical protein [Mycobacterium riyadhense]